INANNDYCCETHAECMMEWERKYACAYYQFVTLNEEIPPSYFPEPIEIEGFECEDYFCMYCDPPHVENEDHLCFREYFNINGSGEWNDKYTDCGPGKCFDMHDDDCDGTNVGDDDNDTDTDYGDSCYSEALEYIDTHLLTDFSNACEVYEYVIENFDCLDEYEEETVDEHEDTEDEWEDDGGNDTPPVEEEYNEEQRKPIWWYHSDHLGSSSYITDNFGRPSHYYEYLPFGELLTEHNQSKYYIDPYPTQNMDSYNN